MFVFIAASEREGGGGEAGERVRRVRDALSAERERLNQIGGGGGGGNKLHVRDADPIAGGKDVCLPPHVVGRICKRLQCLR